MVGKEAGVVTLAVSAQPRGLQYLSGCWKGVELSEPSPWDPGSDLTGSRFELRTDQEGLCLIADYTEQRSGRPPYRAHAVLGWDEEQSGPFLFWFDGRSGGACPVPARGRWEDHRLIFECEGPRDSLRFVYQLEGPDQFTFRRECCAGTPSRATVMETRFQRVEAQPAVEPPARTVSCPFRPVCPAAQVMSLGQRAP